MRSRFPDSSWISQLSPSELHNLDDLAAQADHDFAEHAAAPDRPYLTQVRDFSTGVLEQALTAVTWRSPR
jgi:hypothetical protein